MKCLTCGKKTDGAKYCALGKEDALSCEDLRFEVVYKIANKKKRRGPGKTKASRYVRKAQRKHNVIIGIEVFSILEACRLAEIPVCRVNNLVQKKHMRAQVAFERCIAKDDITMEALLARKRSMV